MKHVFKDKLKPIGMRNIKTAIAIVICVFISQIFKLEYPFYACIAAIITMRGSVFGTFKAARHRMLGTTVGAVVGLICVLIAPRSAILSGIGIVVIIYICNVLEWDDSISIAGIVFLAIMVNLKGTTPIFYAVNRLIDTFIGITVAALVNYFIFPPKLSEKIAEASNATLDKHMKTIRKLVDTEGKISLDELSRDIKKLETELKLLKSEGKIRKSERLKIYKLDKLVTAFRNIYIHLSAIEIIELRPNLSSENVQKYATIYNDIYSSKDKISLQNDIEIIYNFHIGKAFDLIMELEENDENN